MVIQVILILVVIIFIAYSLGIGGEIIEDAVAGVREAKEKQKDIADPAIFDVGNFAADTGTRICDLSIKFYGTVMPWNNITLENIPIVNNDDLWLWHGDIKTFLGTDLTDDDRIIEYEWFCPTVNVSAASIFWNLRQNTLELLPSGSGTPSQLTLFEQIEPKQLDILSDISGGIDQFVTLVGSAETNGETIRMMFQAESLNTGKLMLDKNAFGLDNKPFQASIDLPFGSDFPYNYIISTRLQDVTEDDYTLMFWNDVYPQNNLDPGFRFEYFICSPTSLATNTIGVVIGKTIFGERFEVNLDQSRPVEAGC